MQRSVIRWAVSSALLPFAVVGAQTDQKAPPRIDNLALGMLWTANARSLPCSLRQQPPSEVTNRVCQPSDSVRAYFANDTLDQLSMLTHSLWKQAAGLADAWLDQKSSLESLLGVPDSVVMDADIGARRLRAYWQPGTTRQHWGAVACMWWRDGEEPVPHRTIFRSLSLYLLNPSHRTVLPAPTCPTA